MDNIEHIRRLLIIQIANLIGHNNLKRIINPFDASRQLNPKPFRRLLLLKKVG